MNSPRRSFLCSFFLTPLIGVLGSAYGADFPKGSPKFEKSYRSALSAAKKAGKPAVLVFSATWCGPCQAMKKDVYPSEAIKPFHDKFVWAYLDTDDKDNEKPAKEFGVNGIPHIQFVSSEGKTLGNQVGSSTPEDFAKKLEGVIAKAGSPAPPSSPSTSATTKKS
ncbi:MAG: thioredoxin family protein [Verrucomicrobiales bacterium]